MIREIEKQDLNNLLLLYTQLHNDPIPENSYVLKTLWEKILADQNHHIIVAVDEEKIVSSCVIVIVPNLTHNQRSYALIENVITDISYRRKGIAMACLNYAKEIALKENCYKIMLLTGSKESGTLQFYERAGFNCHDKTAFIQWLNL
ncbi:MAG: GNAT family N-acetyltransferase [Syntrophomonadaceae bacterium]|nr:GNAT family N-acetyltransferase [Syntrophomonadaceae bacterium]